MARQKRDFKQEYQRRKEKGLARGLSLAEARGHRKAKRRRRYRREMADPKSKVEQAIKGLKDGAFTSASKVAKHYKIAPETFLRELHERTNAVRKGRRWIIIDKRQRRFPVYSEGRLRDPILSPKEATKASEYMRAVDRFLNSGDRALLAPFVGKGVKDVKRAFLPFEVDPNALYRLDAAGELSFPEIYKIVQ